MAPARTLALAEPMEVDLGKHLQNDREETGTHSKQPAKVSGISSAAIAVNVGENVCLGLISLYVFLKEFKPSGM